jgi:hypothetical protein
MNKYEIFVSPKALMDIEDAVHYYNELSWGLGNKFLTDFDRVFRSLKLNPFFAAVKYENIRCAAFNKFPFSIHYFINTRKKTATIVAVFNTWKEPFW